MPAVGELSAVKLAVAAVGRAAVEAGTPEPEAVPAVGEDGLRRIRPTMRFGDVSPRSRARDKNHPPLKNATPQCLRIFTCVAPLLCFGPKEQSWV